MEVTAVSFNGQTDIPVLSAAAIQINYIDGLREELDAIKAENAKLLEWLSYGKYSAK